MAPIRDEEFTREYELEYLKKKGIPVSEKIKDYSINVGILGTTIGGKETKKTLGLPPDEMYPHVKPLHETENEPYELTLEYEKGIPISLNGKKMEGTELIIQLRNS